MAKFCRILGILVVFQLFALNTNSAVAAETGCLACHNGIENIRDKNSIMMQLITTLSASNGDSSGCVMCHGGDPGATLADAAHNGSPKSLTDFGGPKTFYPDPGAMDINKFTCGQAACHKGYEERLEKSLMNTEAGKIQGNLHTWGIPEVQNYKVPWGNYNVKDNDGQVSSVGTEAYKAYMKDMIAAHQEQFPTELTQVPNPSVEEIEKDPKLAGITYQRQECQRCHVTVKGREARGDYRGQGCSSCHIPYGNEGIYEGNDPTIDKKEHGHMLSHQIQATPVLPYEHALKHESGALEMRFIVRPLNRIRIDYIDPHNAAPEPNHLFPLLFESITNQLSVGSDTPNRIFSESAARDNFNAHWAAAAVFDVDPEFASGYQSGFLIGMHRNQMADAYTLFLYNDHEQAKTLINAALSTMSFAESMPATE